MRKILAFIISCILVFTLTACNTTFIFGKGNELNLNGYDLVFFDDFNGDSLDTSRWEYRSVGPVRVHGATLNEIKTKAYCNHPKQVSVKDGCLAITGEYTTSEYGESWHSASIRLKDFYTYGYFEIKCIPNNSADFWSAFWLQSGNSYNHDISQGGRYGAEIDIFETYKNHDLTTKGFITSTIHCNGFDEIPDKVDSKRVVKAYVNNLYSDYTTFGLMWTETEYIFYVNGIESGRSSFANGTSCVPEEVIVSLCAPDNIKLDKSTTTRFRVDSVKIYQISK